MKAEKFEAILAHLKKIGVLQRWRKGPILLHNWSEPTLNPEINKILSILNKYNFKGSISSNFIAPWNIEPAGFRQLEGVVFSLCSLEEERYKRIYGADLQTTLNNFKDFMRQKQEYCPDMEVSINWLRYKFNDDELETARAYFTQLGAVFSDDYYAYVNDLRAHLSYCRSKGTALEGYDLEEALSDFDFDIMERIQAHPCAFKADQCPFGQGIIVTEDGQLAHCCVITSQFNERRMGDILTLNRKDIARLKKNVPICKECIKYRLPNLLGHGNRNFLSKRIFAE
jgi:hypothetical protein